MSCQPGDFWVAEILFLKESTGRRTIKTYQLLISCQTRGHEG